MRRPVASRPAAACTPTPAQLEVPARIVEQGLSTPSGAIPIQGLYFGELEIVAYQYRPGASLQTGQHFGTNGTHDWSYWVVLQSGHDAAAPRSVRTSRRRTSNMRFTPSQK